MLDTGAFHFYSMHQSHRKALIEHLKTFATPERWNKLVEVAAKRTRYLTVVMEDIYQPHNASAVLRSCDGFGIQDVHIIENRNQFEASSQVTIGADRWLSLQRYNAPEENNTETCLRHLKQKGYSIIATSPHKDDINLNDLSLDRKTALVFGTELDGISDTVSELADGFVRIPMAGFSESFNISVSVAICLYNLTRRLKSSEIDWQLSEVEQEDLTYRWLKKSVKAGEQIEKAFLSSMTE